jgi:hypothetical protein
MILFQTIDGGDRVAKVDFAERTVVVDDIDKFLKFAPWEPVDQSDVEQAKIYSNNLYKCIPADTLMKMFHDLTTVEKSIDSEPLMKAFQAGLISLDDIEKAWKKQPVGAVVTHADGSKWRKRSETGDPKQDWELVKKEGSKNSDESTSKTSGEGENKPSEEQLAEHAKNTSKTNLEAAIKESSDPEMRMAAENELKRREQEERPQEDKENKAENNQYIEKFRQLSDSQIQFYLDAPYEEVKKAAKFIADERGLKLTETFSGRKFKDNKEIENFFDEYEDQGKNLSDNQIKSISQYRGIYYKGMNDFLRGKNDTSDSIKRALKEVQSSFDHFKLKDDIEVFRGIPSNIEFFGKLKEGDVYKDDAFVSTSLDKNVIGDFGYKNGFTLNIRLKKGQNAMPIANIGEDQIVKERKYEAEVLIKNGSQFKVIKKEGNNITVELV